MEGALGPGASLGFHPRLSNHDRQFLLERQDKRQERLASEDSSHPSAKIPESLGNLGVSWEEVED